MTKFNIGDKFEATVKYFDDIDRYTYEIEVTDRTDKMLTISWAGGDTQRHRIKQRPDGSEYFIVTNVKGADLDAWGKPSINAKDKIKTMDINYYNDQLSFTEEQVEAMVDKALAGEITEKETLELFREDIEKDMTDALIVEDYGDKEFTDDEFDQMIQSYIEKDFESVGLEITQDFRSEVLKQLEARIKTIQNNIKNLKL